VQGISSVGRAPVSKTDADNHLALDLYLPDSLRAEACVIYAHGGGFLSGGRGHVEAVHFAKHFTDAGFALASVSYRLGTPAATFNARDQGYIEDDAARSARIGLTLSPKLYGPAFFAAMEDLSKAVSFLWMEGPSIGVATPKVGILGVSAGGIAALALAYPPALWRHRVSRPDAVVAISAAFVQPWRLEEDGPCPARFGLDFLPAFQEPVDQLALQRHAVAAAKAHGPAGIERPIGLGQVHRLTQP